MRGFYGTGARRPELEASLPEQGLESGQADSVRLGFDEAIMPDPSGFVAECTGENIVLVRGERS